MRPLPWLGWLAFSLTSASSCSLLLDAPADPCGADDDCVRGRVCRSGFCTLDTAEPDAARVDAQADARSEAAPDAATDAGGDAACGLPAPVAGGFACGVSAVCTVGTQVCCVDGLSQARCLDRDADSGAIPSACKDDRPIWACATRAHCSAGAFCCVGVRVTDDLACPVTTADPQDAVCAAACTGTDTAACSSDADCSTLERCVRALFDSPIGKHEIGLCRPKKI